MRKQFGLGDDVKVISSGMVCSAHHTAAKIMCAEHWERNRGSISGHLRDGMKGIITNKWSDLYLIRLEDGCDYVFKSGFTLYKKAKIKPYGICDFITKYYK